MARQLSTVIVTNDLNESMTLQKILFEAGYFWLDAGCEILEHKRVFFIEETLKGDKLIMDVPILPYDVLWFTKRYNFQEFLLKFKINML